jgi:hypothetical protein
MWNIAGIAIVLTVVSFGVNVAEGRLIQRLAPRSAAELSLAAGPPARSTDAPCAYVGPAAADACDSARSVSNPCPPVSSEAYDACPQQQLALAQGVCTNLTRDSGSYDACMRVQLQELATQMAEHARDSAQLLTPGTLPCPGYDPSLPAPDSCPPGTPRAY